MRKSFENSSTRLAAGLLAAGLGASALSGCSAAEKHSGTGGAPVLANQCFTDFVGNVKNKYGENVQYFLPSYGVVLAKLENELQKTTGNRHTNGYGEVSVASRAIQDALVEHYAEEDTEVSTDSYSVKEKKPFNKALFNFCVGEDGKITPGLLPGISPDTDPLDHCTVIYDQYIKEARNNPDAFKDCLEGEFPTPNNR
jgi:hypothetical protein